MEPSSPARKKCLPSSLPSFLPRDSGNERAFLKKISIFAFLLFPSFLLLTLLSRQSETEEGKSKGKKKNKGKKQSAFRLRLDHGGKIFCHFFLPIFCRRVQLSESRPGKKFDVDVEGEKIYDVQKLEHGKQNRLSFQGKKSFWPEIWGNFEQSSPVQ